MYNPFDLTGKTILVTGASSGIGRQTCITISQLGGTVIATGRNIERLEELIQNLPGQGHRFIQMELTDPESQKNAIAQLPKLNGLVHSAGIVELLPVKFITEKKLTAIYRTNYEGPVIFTSQLLKKKLISDGSSIIFMASITGFEIGMKGNSMYAGTKAALTGFSRSLALEIAPQKIRSNCIAAGMVQTPMATYSEAMLSAELIEEDKKKYPLGYGEPEDVANTIVFLLSDAGKWITGTTIVIDGGCTAQ